MEQELFNKFSTTELLKSNLTDFLEEVRSDIETNKHHHKLVETGSITQTDMLDFLKRISDNFDLEKCRVILNDIEEWEIQFFDEEYATAREWEFIFTDEGKPYITENMKEVLSEKLSENKVSHQITLPNNILNLLQETRCSNDKAFIEDAMAKPLKWLQNKQLLREFLTYTKIKGSFSIAEIERQTPDLFIDKNGKKLNLAKPKKLTDKRDHNRLMNILATL